MKNPKGIGNIEYAYYRMATDTGIKMMESRLLPEKDNCHFMTKRFDRLDDGEKLHVQSLAAILRTSIAEWSSMSFLVITMTIPRTMFF